jgi:putative phosphoribosyl transferase
MDYALSSPEGATGIHPQQLEVSFVAGDAVASATLNVPPPAKGLVVLFASPGSSRFDAGPRFIAEVLEQAGLATLSLDPLGNCGVGEVQGVIEWLRRESFTAALSVGLLASGVVARQVIAAAQALELPSVVLTEGEPAAKAAELAVEQLLQCLHA